MFQKIIQFFNDWKPMVLKYWIAILVVLAVFFSVGGWQGYKYGKVSGAVENEKNMQSALKNSLNNVLQCVSKNQLREKTTGVNFVASAVIVDCFNKVFIK